MTPLFPVLLLSVLLAVLGVAAGATGRLLLRRLRRGARVPPPWCEAGVAVAWGATGAVAGAGVLPLRRLPVLLALGWFGVAVGAVDVAHRRLPDALTLPALPVAVLLLLPLGPGTVLRGAAGAVLAVAAHAAVHLAAPAAMGAGDVKLAAPLGAVLAAASWPALALAGLLAALLSGGVAVVVLVSARVLGLRAPATGVPAARAAPDRGRGIALPHGPAMAAAAWLVATAAAVGARGP